MEKKVNNIKINIDQLKGNHLTFVGRHEKPDKNKNDYSFSSNSIITSYKPNENIQNIYFSIYALNDFKGEVWIEPLLRSFFKNLKFI